ncbi:MAG: FAD-dependent oxidoreductase, partial [Planctomycetota bacterium]
MSETVSFARRIPVRHDVDVFVAGGGPAGVATAVSAARQGRSVFLAEGHSCFGGMGTAGLVPAFMTFGDGEHFLAAGIGEEILDRLHEAGGTGHTYDPARKRRGAVDIRAEVLKRVCDDLVAEAGVGFAFHTALVAVAAGDGHLAAAICAAKSGLFAVTAKVYVDGTGDGDLCAWAGAPFEKGDSEGTMMPGTLCSLWADVDWETVDEGGLGAGNRRIEKAFADGVFTHEDRHLPGMWKVHTTVGGGNIGHTYGVDGTDERSVTEALVWGRRSMLEYERYYKQYLEGFEQMKLVATASLLGLRETR